MPKRQVPPRRPSLVVGLPWVDSAARKNASRQYAYPREASSPAFKLGQNPVRQRRIKVIRDPSFAFEQTKDKRPFLFLKGGQTSNRFAGAGDHDVRSGRSQVDEFGELGFGIVDVVCLHRQPPDLTRSSPAQLGPLRRSGHSIFRLRRSQGLDESSLRQICQRLSGLSR